MNLIVLARVRGFGFYRISRRVQQAYCAGTLAGPVGAMTRDAGCELNLVLTLRHMINANNRPVGPRSSGPMRTGPH